MLKLFFISILLCLTSIISYSQDIAYDSIITILEKRDTTIEHQDHDIEIVTKKDGYWIYVYRIENDTIRPFRVGLGAKGSNFDKARCKWDVNNGVVVQMFESKTGINSGLVSIKGNKRDE